MNGKVYRDTPDRSKHIISLEKKFDHNLNHKECDPESFRSNHNNINGVWNDPQFNKFSLKSDKRKQQELDNLKHVERMKQELMNVFFNFEY